MPACIFSLTISSASRRAFLPPSISFIIRSATTPFASTANIIKELNIRRPLHGGPYKDESVEMVPDASWIDKLSNTHTRRVCDEVERLVVGSSTAKKASLPLWTHTTLLLTTQLPPVTATFAGRSGLDFRERLSRKGPSESGIAPLIAHIRGQ